jgi:hypothetical protein
MQTRVIRIMMGCRYRESCKELFKALKILFFVNNRDHSVSNSVHHSNNTRQRKDLHFPQATLAMYHNRVYHSGIKIFNGLPKAIKDISRKPKFIIAQKYFLHTYTLIL